MCVNTTWPFVNVSPAMALNVMLLSFHHSKNLCFIIISFLVRRAPICVNGFRHAHNGGRINVLLTAPHTTTFPHAFVLPIHFLRMSSPCYSCHFAASARPVSASVILYTREACLLPVSLAVRLRFSMHFVGVNGFEPLSMKSGKKPDMAFVHLPMSAAATATPSVFVLCVAISWRHRACCFSSRSYLSNFKSSYTPLRMFSAISSFA